MILVDANQIAISHLMVRHKIDDGINIDSIRHSIVRVIARIEKKFKNEFGKSYFATMIRTIGGVKSSLTTSRIVRRNGQTLSMTGTRCFPY